MKTKIAFLTLVLSALTLAGCDNSGNGGTDTNKCKHKWGDPIVLVEPTEEAKGSQKKVCTLCGLERTEDLPKLLPGYFVTFKDASGAEISKTKYTLGTGITEVPANPTAPAGQKFYGWMNKANGGQIWNFEKSDVNKVVEDITLEPLFVKDEATRYLEAELCPIITEDKNGTGMDGATYSGGQKGKGLIKKDYESAYSSTCMIDPYYYVKDGDDVSIVPEGTADAKKMDPVGDGYGFFVHYNYVNGNTFTWNINVSQSAENVAVFGRFSAEYGIPNKVTDELVSEFTSDEVKVKVNGEILNYGTIAIHNIVDKECITFEDFYLGNVNLKAGDNKVEFIIDNTRTVNGTIASTSPCIDCLKLITNSEVTWSEAKLDNIVL